MAYSPCANNCGFFGSPQNDNLCSVCFQRQTIYTPSHRASPSGPVIVSIPITDGPSSSAEDTSVPVVFVSSSKKNGDSAGRSLASFSAVGSGSGDPHHEPVKSRLTRCGCCNKKVGLSGVRCRCGTVYCYSHRFPDQHDCTFDFKTHDRAALAKANPLVEASKINKI
ncbi:hypothetical protein KP509_02G026700 [Ceratopteris richardii]|uniref:Uncharacterized protein n=1 Tax=Ceratopteris richardii TaxID=49495 RepID=A0A8T2VBT9_CERRI|nr:hypothetical protein KP509_02G026700 [Ceratopteris richardii]